MSQRSSLTRWHCTHLGRDGISYLHITQHSMKVHLPLAHVAVISACVGVSWGPRALPDHGTLLTLSPARSQPVHGTMAWGCRVYALAAPVDPGVSPPPRLSAAQELVFIPVLAVVPAGAPPTVSLCCGRGSFLILASPLLDHHVSQPALLSLRHLAAVPPGLLVAGFPGEG